jgi:hypothetical protein
MPHDVQNLLNEHGNNNNNNHNNNNNINDNSNNHSFPKSTNFDIESPNNLTNLNLQNHGSVSLPNTISRLPTYINGPTPFIQTSSSLNYHPGPQKIAHFPTQSYENNNDNYYPHNINNNNNNNHHHHPLDNCFTKSFHNSSNTLQLINPSELTHLPTDIYPPAPPASSTSTLSIPSHQSSENARMYSLPPHPSTSNTFDSIHGHSSHYYHPLPPPMTLPEVNIYNSNEIFLDCLGGEKNGPSVETNINNDHSSDKLKNLDHMTENLTNKIDTDGFLLNSPSENYNAPLKETPLSLPVDDLSKPEEIIMVYKISPKMDEILNTIHNSILKNDTSKLKSGLDKLKKECQLKKEIYFEQNYVQNNNNSDQNNRKTSSPNSSSLFNNFSIINPYGYVIQSIEVIKRENITTPNYNNPPRKNHPNINHSLLDTEAPDYHFYKPIPVYEFTVRYWHPIELKSNGNEDEDVNSQTQDSNPKSNKKYPVSLFYNSLSQTGPITLTHLIIDHIIDTSSYVSSTILFDVISTNRFTFLPSFIEKLFHTSNDHSVILSHPATTKSIFSHLFPLIYKYPYTFINIFGEPIPSECLIAEQGSDQFSAEISFQDKIKNDNSFHVKIEETVKNIIIILLHYSINNILTPPVPPGSGPTMTQEYQQLLHSSSLQASTAVFEALIDVYETFFFTQISDLSRSNAPIIEEDERIVEENVSSSLFPMKFLSELVLRSIPYLSLVDTFQFLLDYCITKPKYTLSKDNLKTAFQLQKLLQDSPIAQKSPNLTPIIIDHNFLFFFSKRLHRLSPTPNFPYHFSQPTIYNFSSLLLPQTGSVLPHISPRSYFFYHILHHLSIELVPNLISSSSVVPPDHAIRYNYNSTPYQHHFEIFNKIIFKVTPSPPSAIRKSRNSLSPAQELIPPQFFSLHSRKIIHQLTAFLPKEPQAPSNVPQSSTRRGVTRATAGATPISLNSVQKGIDSSYDDSLQRKFELRRLDRDSILQYISRIDLLRSLELYEGREDWRNLWEKGIEEANFERHLKDTGEQSENLDNKFEEFQNFRQLTKNLSMNSPSNEEEVIHSPQQLNLSNFNPKSPKNLSLTTYGDDDIISNNPIIHLLLWLIRLPLNPLPLFQLIAPFIQHINENLIKKNSGEYSTRKIGSFFPEKILTTLYSNLDHLLNQSNKVGGGLEIIFQLTRYTLVYHPRLYVNIFNYVDNCVNHLDFDQHIKISFQSSENIENKRVFRIDQEHQKKLASQKDQNPSADPCELNSLPFDQTRPVSSIFSTESQIPQSNTETIQPFPVLSITKFFPNKKDIFNQDLTTSFPLKFLPLLCPSFEIFIFRFFYTIHPHFHPYIQHTDAMRSLQGLKPLNQDFFHKNSHESGIIDPNFDPFPPSDSQIQNGSKKIPTPPTDQTPVPPPLQTNAHPSFISNISTVNQDVEKLCSNMYPLSYNLRQLLFLHMFTATGIKLDPAQESQLFYFCTQDSTPFKFSTFSPGLINLKYSPHFIQLASGSSPSNPHPLVDYNSHLTLNDSKTYPYLWYFPESTKESIQNVVNVFFESISKFPPMVSLLSPMIALSSAAHFTRAVNTLLGPKIDRSAVGQRNGQTGQIEVKTSGGSVTSGYSMTSDVHPPRIIDSPKKSKKKAHRNPPSLKKRAASKDVAVGDEFETAETNEHELNSLASNDDQNKPTNSNLFENHEFPPLQMDQPPQFYSNQLILPLVNPALTDPSLIGCENGSNSTHINDTTTSILSFDPSLPQDNSDNSLALHHPLSCHKFHPNDSLYNTSTQVLVHRPPLQTLSSYQQQLQQQQQQQQQQHHDSDHSLGVPMRDRNRQYKPSYHNSQRFSQSNPIPSASQKQGSLLINLPSVVNSASSQAMTSGTMVLTQPFSANSLNSITKTVPSLPPSYQQYPQAMNPSISNAHSNNSVPFEFTQPRLMSLLSSNQPLQPPPPPTSNLLMPITQSSFSRDIGLIHTGSVGGLLGNSINVVNHPLNPPSNAFLTHSNQTHNTAVLSSGFQNTLQGGLHNGQNNQNISNSKPRSTISPHTPSSLSLTSLLPPTGTTRSNSSRRTFSGVIAAGSSSGDLHNFPSSHIHYQNSIQNGHNNTINNNTNLNGNLHHLSFHSNVLPPPRNSPQNMLIPPLTNGNITNSSQIPNPMFPQYSIPQNTLATRSNGLINNSMPPQQ